MNLTTEYPLWFSIFCLALAFVYAYVLYRKESRFDELARWKVLLMGVFRFLAVGILSFLLLSPMIKTITKSIEKPIVVFVQDNSESLVIGQDSSFIKGQYSTDIHKFIQDLSTNYDVNTYAFGEELNSDTAFLFTEKITDFSQAFSQIQNRYANRNVGAVVFASDGIYNSGQNPVYLLSNVDYPVYTLALGDTSVKKDAVLSKINHNSIAFLGNKFPIQAFIDVRKYKDKTIELKIEHKGQIVFSQTTQATNDAFSDIFNAELKAEEVGTQFYRVSIQPLPDEVNLQNNYKDIAIDVIDSKQKILILGAAPHPDMGALRRSLETNENYEVSEAIVSDFSGDIESFNLIVMHQLPALGQAAQAITSRIFDKKIPVLFVVGSRTDIRLLNSFNAGLIISQSGQSADDAQAIFNDNFTLFETPVEVQDLAALAPPLSVPFGNYKVASTAEVLFQQRIRNVATTKPLFVFNQQVAGQKHKVGFIIGEGIWRWHLTDFMKNQSHEAFNELTNKITQYLALRANKERFVVETKNVFNENEPVSFDAEVYNESYELITDPEVRLEITNDDGRVFEFTFAKTAHAYLLNAGTFPVGRYSYQANVVAGGESLVKNGVFSVIPLNLESKNTVADHQLLYQISAQTGGSLYYPVQLDSLLTSILSDKSMVPVSFSEKQLMDFINLRWIFFIVFVLLTIEWFMRKFYGNY